MRRDKLDLLRDILAVCSEKKAKKTEIVYRSNMNFLKIAGYLDWLIVHQFLTKEGSFYEITPEGLSLLSQLNEIVGKDGD